MHRTRHGQRPLAAGECVTELGAVPGRAAIAGTPRAAQRVACSCCPWRWSKPTGHRGDGHRRPRGVYNQGFTRMTGLRWTASRVIAPPLGRLNHRHRLPQPAVVQPPRWWPVARRACKPSAKAERQPVWERQVVSTPHDEQGQCTHLYRGQGRHQRPAQAPLRLRASRHLHEQALGLQQQRHHDHPQRCRRPRSSSTSTRPLSASPATAPTRVIGLRAALVRDDLAQPDLEEIRTALREKREGRQPCATTVGRLTVLERAAHCTRARSHQGCYHALCQRHQRRQRARALPTGPGIPGQPRQPDRAGQPQPAARPHRAGHCLGQAQRPRHRRDAAGPGSLQARQRCLRPQRGRRPAAGGGTA